MAVAKEFIIPRRVEPSLPMSVRKISPMVPSSYIPAVKVRPGEARVIVRPSRSLPLRGSGRRPERHPWTGTDDVYRWLRAVAALSVNPNDALVNLPLASRASTVPLMRTVFAAISIFKLAFVRRNLSITGRPGSA